MRANKFKVRAMVQRRTRELKEITDEKTKEGVRKDRKT